MNTKYLTLSDNDKIDLIGNLATMLSAGIPILEAVDSLLEEAKGHLKIVLETLRADLTQGKQVSYSFAKFPSVFNKVTVNIIKASEQAGTLEVTLKDLKENIKKEIEFTDRVKSALVYPVFISVVFGGVLLMILIIVIPKISQVFTNLKVELPLPTKILIFISNIMLKYPFEFIGAAVLFVIAFIFLYRREKRLLVEAFLSLPVISRVALDIDLTRFTRSLHLLLNAGIPITSALYLAQDIVMKKEVTRSIQHATERVAAGEKLSKGFKDTKHIFPTIMIKITEAGEKSGSLDRSMQEISEYLDYQVSHSLKTATSLLEPIMLVLIGGLIGSILLAIIAPIYGLIGQVGGK